MNQSTDITYVKSVGPKKAELFRKLGIFTVRDLIHFFPRDYIDMTHPLPIAQTRLWENGAVIATIATPVTTLHARPGMEVFKTLATDGTGEIELVFFNRKYAAQNLKPGETYLFYGKFEGNLLRRQLVNPYVEKGGNGGILPVYPLTGGLTQYAVRTAVKHALSGLSETDEVLPEQLSAEQDLCPRRFALQNIHVPIDMDALDRARKRLAFEELLIFSAALQQLKTTDREQSPFVFDWVDLTPLLDALGFTLTTAQSRVLHECLTDYQTGLCQNRLIQGDVGSGKTAVAAAVIYHVVKNGCQAALMAPTEVLANQHYEYLSKLFAPLGITVGLLTGNTKAASRRAILAGAAGGEIDLLVGTHALLTETVRFQNLALVVTDEQHRFGVKQREILFQKGRRPHVLVMSATPIPRTLALILYAELDVSQIDELPAGRKPVKTYSVTTELRERLYGFVKKHVLQGRQAYVICARAEDDGESELQSVRQLCEFLQSAYLTGLSCEYIYGKMGAKKKDDILRRFYDGQLQVLVSTTVVEVGVNVPNACVMVIENAERFGLSQLHQLRGRVGRGGDQSYCILVSDARGEASAARLDIMTKTNDGFAISQRDLELRGPGEFFGVRQSGLVRFKIANLLEDMDTLIKARDAAAVLLEQDPSLTCPPHAPLRRAVDELLRAHGQGAL